jgi:large subunit ribosomal protein L10
VLSRAQKQEQAEEIKDKFSRATCVYLADYRGIDVESVNRLRRRIRVEGGGDYEYRVVKNTVIQRAAAETDMAGISGHFEGPTAVAISYGDPVGLAKILAEFADEHDVFEIKAGLLEGSPIEADEIRKLATLPSLEALRGMIVGLLVAPATKIARVVSEPGAQLARVLAARGRQED